MNATTKTLLPAVKDMRTAANLLSNITRKYGDRPAVIKMLATELAQLAIAEEQRGITARIGEWEVTPEYAEKFSKGGYEQGAINSPATKEAV